MIAPSGGEAGADWPDVSSPAPGSSVPPNPAPANPVSANPARGEAMLSLAGGDMVLRPSFTNLVAAEGELGPLFALVDRAASGALGVGELVGLFWHCLADRQEGMTRDRFGELVVAQGLAGVTPALKTLLGQILQGR